MAPTDEHVNFGAGPMKNLQLSAVLSEQPLSVLQWKNGRAKAGKAYDELSPFVAQPRQQRWLELDAELQITTGFVGYHGGDRRLEQLDK